MDPKDIKDAYDNPDKYLKLSVLICGKTGIGKSTLVNGLVGTEACSVGDPGKRANTLSSGEDDSDDDAFGAETKELQSQRATVHGVPVIIWDSPGLQDGTKNEEKYLEMMYDSCRNVDLILYCQDMTTSRWTRPEKEATRLLTQKFGVEFWEKCVLVLTKANAVCPDLDREETKYDYWKKLYHNFVEKFRSQLKKQGVPKEIADDIPGVAVGRIGHNPDDRFLWYISDKMETMVKARTKQDFLPEFWITCFERVPSLGREKLLDMCGNDRIKPTDARSKETHAFWHYMQEREKLYAVIKQQFDAYSSSFSGMIDYLHSYLSSVVGGSAYGQSPKTSTQVQCATNPASPQVSDGAVHQNVTDVAMHHETTNNYVLNIGEEQMKRLNDKLASDQKTKSGVLYRIAKWVKAKLSKKK